VLVAATFAGATRGARAAAPDTPAAAPETPQGPVAPGAPPTMTRA